MEEKNIKQRLEKEYQNALSSKKLGTKEGIADYNSKLDDIADQTFYLANTHIFFLIHKALIDHQLRIIQYHQLLNKHNELFKQQSNLQDPSQYNQEVKEALKIHDSDKLMDLNVIKHYIAQEFIAKLKDDNIDPKIFKDIARDLRKIHGDNNKHHDEYYNSHQEDFSYDIIIEHVLDVLSIGDKKMEVIGEFYSSNKAKAYKNFSKAFDPYITQLYNFFKENIFPIAENSKQELEELKKKRKAIQDQNSAEAKILDDQIKETEERISRETEEVVWQDVQATSDNLTNRNMHKMRNLLKNTYLAIEDNWQSSQDKADREKVIEQLKAIAEYKKHIFDNNDIDLKELLKEAVEQQKEEELKLVRIAGVLSTIKEIEGEDKTREVMQSHNLNTSKVKNHMDYIEKRKKDKEVQDFYVARK